MKKKTSKKEQLIREAVRVIIRKTIKEGRTKPKGDVDYEYHEEHLPQQYVKEMVNYADKYTSQRLKFHVWKEVWCSEIKTSDQLVNELKEFIPKEKHKLFMELAEMIKNRYKVK